MPINDPTTTTKKKAAMHANVNQLPRPAFITKYKNYRTDARTSTHGQTRQRLVSQSQSRETKNIDKKTPTPLETHQQQQTHSTNVCYSSATSHTIVHAGYSIIHPHCPRDPAIMIMLQLRTIIPNQNQPRNNFACGER